MEQWHLGSTNYTPKSQRCRSHCAPQHSGFCDTATYGGTATTTGSLSAAKTMSKIMCFALLALTAALPAAFAQTTAQANASVASGAKSSLPSVTANLLRLIPFLFWWQRSAVRSKASGKNCLMAQRTARASSPRSAT